MEFTLVYLDNFETEFKGKKYKVYRFLDVQSLTIITGTDLKEVYVPYKTYKCLVEFKNNKLKIVSSI